MSKRAALYARVSSDDRNNATSSLEGQLEMCREYTQRQGWRVVAEFAEDERGVSGARWDAPELNRALDMALGGQMDVLVVREMDRFARNLAKQLVIEEQFRKAGADVVYVLEEYADSPEGRLGKHIRATIAEYEREKTRQRTTRGRRRSVAHGNVLVHGYGAPYGYRLVKENGRAILVICEEEAQIVRLIFEWYTKERLTIRAIARRLSELRIPTPADNKKYPDARKKRAVGEWVAGSVANILNKEAYAGTWWYGKRNGRTINPQEHLLPVKVPAIISRETWELSQTRKVGNKALAGRNTHHDYLLRVLLKCGQCNAPVRVVTIKKPNGGINRYYRCSAAKGGDYVHTCDMPYFRADVADAVVWEWVKDLMSNPQMIREKAEAWRAQREEATRPYQDKLAVLDGLLNKEREHLDRLLDLYLEGELQKDALIDRQKRMETSIKALEADRIELKAKIEAQTLTVEQINNLEDIIGEGRDLSEMDFAERRYVVEELSLHGELRLVDGRQHVHVSIYLGDEALLDVSRIIYDSFWLLR